MSKKFHLELLTLIKENSGKGTKHTADDDYLGTSHYRYLITKPLLRSLVKEWAKANSELNTEELCLLISSLVKADSSTEKVTAGLLLDYFPKQRAFISPVFYEEWLEHIEGWNEVDALCQGHFTATEQFEQWAVWEKTILKLSKSKSIIKKRASIALLITPALGSEDKRVFEISVRVMEALKQETAILITKAISWLLRSLVKHHKSAVQNYLLAERETLPRIAVRETMVKLETGKKTGKKK